MRTHLVRGAVFVLHNVAAVSFPQVSQGLNETKFRVYVVGVADPFVFTFVGREHDKDARREYDSLILAMNAF
jgi:hypothetical protein